MFNPKFTITNKITASLTTIERARGFLDAAILSNEWLNSMQKRALMLEAHYTTHHDLHALVKKDVFKVYGATSKLTYRMAD